MSFTSHASLVGPKKNLSEKVGEVEAMRIGDEKAESPADQPGALDPHESNAG